MFLRIVIGIGALLIGAPTAYANDSLVEFIAPEDAPDRPFSDGVRVGNMLYLSGALGTEPGTPTLVSGGIAAETDQALQNIGQLLKANGASLDTVVKCTVMLADIVDYAAMNATYVKHFPGPKPARSTFAASGLALGARVEIECWAAVPD